MFAIHGNRLPVCNSFEAAQNLSASRLKKNEDPAAWRQIIHRDPKFLIREDLVAGSVQLRYHTTTLVEWNAPDSVTLTRNDSRSSRIFINRFTPPGIDAVAHRDDTWFVCGDQAYRANRDMEFVRDDKMRWALADDGEATRFHEYVVDRKRASAIRKALKPWTEWAEAARRLRGDGHLARKEDWPTDNAAAGYTALRRLIEGTPQPYAELYQQPLLHLENLTHHALVLGGAVSKRELPLGEFSKPRSVYDGLRSWVFVE